MAETIINYLKYEISSGHAELIGFDKRKKEIDCIHIPKSINFKDVVYPVVSIARDCLYGLEGRMLEVPNTIKYVGGVAIDLIPYTGHVESQNGLTLKVYEARENPPKKSWWKRIFG